MAAAEGGAMDGAARAGWRQVARVRRGEALRDPLQAELAVDSRDAKTPDDWVRRHPDMTRLTGVHPFNAEGPMPALVEHGFITPNAIHYTRNHGAVPRLSWQAHRVSIVGDDMTLVSLSMDDFLRFPSTSLPVTLTCAGNRRKEENMRAKTVGFSWNTSATSTSVWTGVRLAEVLRDAAGVVWPPPRPRAVVRRGARFKEGKSTVAEEDDQVTAATEGIERTGASAEGRRGHNGARAQGTPPQKLDLDSRDPAQSWESEPDEEHDDDDDQADQGWHVWFIGADDLPNGNYGTSIPLGYVMDIANDVLLAYKQNGQLLHPDRGFPIRLLVPGWIGGRSVKWLKRIELRRAESSNYYHLYDNRILPPQVLTKTIADEGDWWKRPEYLFNELNINSVITHPMHNSALELSGAAPTMTFKGYAYSGGGRRVNRVELTFDEGATWRLADLIVSERPTSYSKHWCWVFWELQVNVVDLLRAPYCAVRAWDNANNGQPQDLTWNLMGMGNNSWFRVHLSPALSSDERSPCLRFVHPTQGAGMDNKDAWMVPRLTNERAVLRDDAGGASAESAQASAPSAGGKDLPEISPQELALHNTENDCWISIRGVVYDCAGFLASHPGGKSSIVMVSGQDCTEDFEGIHSAKAWELLQPLAVAVLKKDGASASSEGSDESPQFKKTWLKGRSYVDFMLTRKTVLNHNTILLRFSPPSTVNRATLNKLLALERRPISHATEGDREHLMESLQAAPDHVAQQTSLGLPVGMHILVKATGPEGPVVRAYTPLVDVEESKHDFSLLVKVYRKTAEFPGGGKMSQHLDSLSVGDLLPVKGPLGHISYTSKGLVVDGVQRRFASIAFICGGTGITPAYRILSSALEDPDDSSVFVLLYSNKRDDDILLRDELDELARRHPRRFHLWYTVSRQNHDSARLWPYSTGRVDLDMIRHHIPQGGNSECFVGLCGPPGFIDRTCLPALRQHGFEKDCIGVF